MLWTVSVTATVSLSHCRRFTCYSFYIRNVYLHVFSSSIVILSNFVSSSSETVYILRRTRVAVATAILRLVVFEIAGVVINLYATNACMQDRKSGY